MLRLSESFAFCVVSASSHRAFSFPHLTPPNAEHLTQRMNEVPVLPLTDTGVLLVSRTTQLSIEQLSRRVSEAFTYEEPSLLRGMGTVSATVAFFCHCHRFRALLQLSTASLFHSGGIAGVRRGVLSSVMNGLPGMRSRSLQVPRAALQLLQRRLPSNLSQKSANCSISAELTT